MMQEKRKNVKILDFKGNFTKTRIDATSRFVRISIFIVKFAKSCQCPEPSSQQFGQIPVEQEVDPATAVP